MTDAKKDKDTERFYKLSYFIIPLPMIAGVVFAAYVLITEDSRNQSYCVVAQSSNAYNKQPLEALDFNYQESITLDICKDKDDTIDDGDGRANGQVRWFVCKGTVCGQGWETILSKK